MSFKLLVVAWLLVGTLDLLAAFLDFYVNSGGSPRTLLQYIASGMYGEAAFKDASNMVIAGLFFHYLIAGLFTFFFFLVFSRIAVISDYWLLLGLTYGIFVWAVMNAVVLPFTKARHVPVFGMTFIEIAKPMAILILTIGVPLALIKLRAVNQKK